MEVVLRMKSTIGNNATDLSRFLEDELEQTLLQLNSRSD